MTEANTPRGTVMVCALYKFVRLPEYRTLQAPVLETMLGYPIRGTLLLAAEGINGTIAGDPADVVEFLGWLQGRPGLGEIDTKISWTDAAPFKRSRVKLKKEIVTMGVEGIDPAQSAGTYVEPEDWNALVDDPDVLLVDTRNDYEIEVGQFENAVDPKTTTFREFPDFARTQLDPTRHKKVAMYCTGGIRCEKSTAFLRQIGFENVYHLKGGILNYLEKVPESDSRWRGECFVFDERVTVDHDLEKGSYDQCHACRRPISENDKDHAHYQQGVSCPHCYGERSDADRQRYAEREKQVALAEKSGRVHIGPSQDK